MVALDWNENTVPYETLVYFFTNAVYPQLLV